MLVAGSEGWTRSFQAADLNFVLFGAQTVIRSDPILHEGVSTEDGSKYDSKFHVQLNLVPSYVVSTVVELCSSLL